MAEPTPAQLAQERNQRWQADCLAARPKLEQPSFQVKDAIHVADPCYTPGGYGVWDLPAVPGRWVGHATLRDEHDGGKCVAQVVVHAADEPPGSDAAWEDAGEIGVDSGQAGVFAASANMDGGDAPQDLDTFYGQCCAITLTEPPYGCIAHGFVASSGFGDGVYPVQVLRRGGRACAVRITFIAEGDADEEGW